MTHDNTKEDVVQLLKYVDERLTEPIVVVLIGGTALTILDKKAASYDIDIIIADAIKKEEFYDAYFEGIKKFGLSMGEHPPYTEFDMGLLNIKDFLGTSKIVKDVKLEKILLYTMNIHDIILSKNFRNLQKDQEDIMSILKQMNISKAELQTRYVQLFRQQTHEIRPKFEESYKRLLSNYGSLLKP